MVKRTTLICIAVLLSLGMVFAQGGKKSKSKSSKADKSNSKFGVATPPSMTELGIHGGYLFVAGDVTPEAGFGGGIHYRKSLDYIFSLRGDILFGEANGLTGTGVREFTMQWYSGSILGVISLNSVRFDKSVRNVNWYALAGGGMNNFETRYETERVTQVREREFNPHITVGAGIAFRIGQRFNVSIEQQAHSVFGRRSDLIDGYELDQNGNRSPFGDLLNYTKVGLNFNIGNPTKLSEPLYWINPLEVVLKDIEELKNGQEIVLEDADNDGVLDIVDKEPNTPPDVPVDTKGRTLDSDRDGVADYKDLEPYNPPRPGEVVNSEGVIENPNRTYTDANGNVVTAGGGVTEERVKELIDEALEEYRLTEPATSVAEWFLPMIHFGSGSFNIRYGDYGTLAGIAKMLKGNSKLKLVVIGFTDETGKEVENQFLSYDRAREVVDHLVVYHGIGRGRLILNLERANGCFSTYPE